MDTQKAQSFGALVLRDIRERHGMGKKGYQDQVIKRLRQSSKGFKSLSNPHYHLIASEDFLIPLIL
jgi:hypothetical protein